MKLTKKLLSLALAGAMALTSAACGGNKNNSGGGNGGGNTTGKETISQDFPRTTGATRRLLPKISENVRK